MEKFAQTTGLKVRITQAHDLEAEKIVQALGLEAETIVLAAG